MDPPKGIDRGGYRMMANLITLAQFVVSLFVVAALTGGMETHSHVLAYAGLTLLLLVGAVAGLSFLMGAPAPHGGSASPASFSRRSP
jgi:hypothetical protein